MKFYIVDAFTNQIFGGNTAGVVLIDKVNQEQHYPDDERMRLTAAELRYSETAFVKQLGEKSFEMRYFTPAAEVELCGHATIGAFGALQSAGIIQSGETCHLKTLSGDLAVSVDNDFILMDMGVPEDVGSIDGEDALRDLAGVMGINAARINMTPKLVSTGLPDIILPVESKDALLSIKPDFPALAELSEKYGAVGVHSFSLADEQEITAYCRNFAPLYDIDEEAATGTANGALTYYLYKAGKVLPGQTNVFLQGESMNRPSKIITTLEEGRSSINENGETGVKIRVGGGYAVVAEGEIYL